MLARGKRRPLSPYNTSSDAIDAGIRWLKLAHDVTRGNGVSKGFSYLFGWCEPFPETTGYIIGTFLNYASRTGDDDAVRRAREMGDWEIKVQNQDGGVIEGLLTKHPKPSTIFNTGMVIHGWLDLHNFSPNDQHLAAAVRGGHFLVANQDTDGAWRGPTEHFRIPHTYSSRVSWALLRLARVTDETQFEDTARRQLDWVLSMQKTNGWFASCIFEPNGKTNTHALAYTLRGLLESYALLPDERYLDAVRRTSEPLMNKLQAQGYLQGAFRSDWNPEVKWQCLTGIAQLGGVWLRFYELTQETRFLDAGRKAVEHAASFQGTTSWPPVRGALAGSYPLYGGYAPLQYPNWATKFLVDALMLQDKLSLSQ
jgi:uncharacterized protein YyaL (SSP411 family)